MDFGSLIWADAFGFTLKRLLLLTLCATGAAGLGSALTLRQLCTVLVCVTFSYLILGIVAELLQGNFRPWASGYRFAGTLHPNAQSTNCGALSLASFSLLRDSRSGGAGRNMGRAKSLLVLALFLCGMFFLLLTKSRTAAAAVVFSVVLIWATAQRIGTNLLMSGTGLLLVLLIGYVLAVTGAQNSVGSAANMGRADSQGAFNGRLPIWEICIDRVGSSIPVGLGYDGFWTPDRISSVSWELGWSICSAHCEYIEIALGLGVVGLAFYLLVQFVGIGWFWLRYVRLGLGGDAMILGLLLVGAVQGFMEAGYLHPSSLAPFIALTGMTRLAFFTDHRTSWNGAV